MFTKELQKVKTFIDNNESNEIVNTFKLTNEARKKWQANHTQ